MGKQLFPLWEGYLKPLNVWKHQITCRFWFWWSHGWMKVFSLFFGRRKHLKLCKAAVPRSFWSCWDKTAFTLPVFLIQSFLRYVYLHTLVKHLFGSRIHKIHKQSSILRILSRTFALPSACVPLLAEPLSGSFFAPYATMMLAPWSLDSMWRIFGGNHICGRKTDMSDTM